MFDIIIKNGRIADGTGEDSYIADIGVKDGVISKIGVLKDEKAEKVIDAAGKLVTPGFIDIHSHGDMTMLIYPKMENFIMQGVTTIVGGNCGLSYAPVDKYLMCFFEYDVVDEIEPFVYTRGLVFPLEKARDKLREIYGLDVSWKTFGEFLNRVEDSGTAVNYIPIVGHGQIRAQAMGEDHKRLASAEEIRKMQEYLEEAMSSGAYGMSVGLDYAPGVYSNFDELLEVSKVLQKYDGIYTAHWRRTGLRTGPIKKLKKIDGVIETLEIGKQLGIRVQISHLHPGYDIFPSNNDYMVNAASEATLQVVDSYVEQGVRAAFDVIPNVTGGIGICPRLVYNFWSYIKQSGSLEQFVKNLKAKDYRAQMVETLNAGQYYLMNPVRLPDWDEFVTVIDSINETYIGKTLKEIAEIHGKSSAETVFELIIEDPEIKIFSRFAGMATESVKIFYSHPLAVVGSDTLAFDLKSLWDGSVKSNGNLPHPNTYCGFIKFIKDFGMPRIEDTIRKATGKSAEIIGLKDRGLIKEGYKADILVIDTDNLKTNENYVEPRVFPEGIDYVLVNGDVAAEKGKHTGALSGKVLRKVN